MIPKSMSSIPIGIGNGFSDKIKPEKRGRAASRCARPRRPCSAPLRVYSKQRNALHSELLARTARVVGDELIGRIVLNLNDLKARRLDMRAVIVLLRGAANACGPKGRIAHDAFGELHLGHD